MAMPPDYLPKALEGLARLAKNGLSYPIPQYGIQSDARAGLGFSYKDVKQAVLPEPAPERFRGCDPAIRPGSPDAGQRRAGGEFVAPWAWRQGQRQTLTERARHQPERAAIALYGCREDHRPYSLILRPSH